MLADPYRLEGEGEVPWELRPEQLAKSSLATLAGTIDRRRVENLIAELQRGLQPTRPPFLKWICDKLSALPTQNGSGLNAALWTDNVIDVCEHYPEDLLQTATLELLRTKTFRPSPAEIVAVIEPRYGERQRMRDRAKTLLAPVAENERPKTFHRPPEVERLRKILAEQQARTDVSDEDRLFNMSHTERSLAMLERRAMAPWAQEFFDARIEAMPVRGKASAAARMVVIAASKPAPWRPGEPLYQYDAEPPPPTEIPEEGNAAAYAEIEP